MTTIMLTQPKADRLEYAPIFIVGAGSLAQKLANILNSAGLSYCFIDEFATGPLLGKTVLKASQLTTADGIFLIAISFAIHAEKAICRLEQQRVRREQCLHLPNDSTAIVLAEMLRLSVSSTLAMLQQPMTNFVEFEQHFFSSEWQQRQEHHGNSLRIGISTLGRGGGYLEHLASIPLQLNQRFDCLHLTDIQPQSIVGMPKLFLSQSAMLEFNQLDLLITAHVFPCSPPAVKKLSMVHMVYDFLLFSAQTYEHLAQADTHYVFVPSAPSLALHEKIYRQQGLSNNLVLIPGGYPKHDANLKKYQQVASTVAVSDCILYAPTLCSLPAASETSDCYSILQAEFFLPQLLETFATAHIIFRPHPEDLALAHLDLPYPRAIAFRKVLAFCQSHPRCTVDDNSSCYLTSFAKAKVVISDTSSVAFSFVLLTNRTAIFYAENHQALETAFDDCQFIKDRNQFGVCVATTEELCRQVALALQPTCQGLHNSAFCREIIFNLGHSVDYLMENMPFILHDIRHPDWIYLQDKIKVTS